jgi:hypothetical protein
MIEYIKINNEWIKFNNILLDIKQSGSKNYFFYAGKRIKARCEIKFACSVCKKNSQFTNFNLKDKDSWDYVCGLCKRKKYYLSNYNVENASQIDSIKEKISLANKKVAKDALIKRKKTCLKKYGVENVSQSKQIQSRKKERHLNKYGVEHHFQRNNVKEKIKKSNLEKYGVEYSCQRKYIKEKIKKKIKEKYGVENVSQIDFVKEKKKQTMIKNHGTNNGFEFSKKAIKEKYGVENPNSFGSDNYNLIIKEKYGVDNISKLDNIKNQKKKTTLKNHGVEYPLQNPTIMQKALSSFGRNMRIKEITENLHYQSNLELDFINYCRSKNIEIIDGPTISYIFNNKKHIYHIDFECDAYLIEIKASHGWYHKNLKSGKIKAKNDAAKLYAKSKNKEFLFLLDVKDYSKYL